MSSKISIRPVTEAQDRLAVLALEHAATARQEPVVTYQAIRLAIPRRARAVWWVLETDGKIVSSLMCYPLLFASAGQQIPGLGGVSTHPSCRGRGYASRLCEHVAQDAKVHGCRVGLLYSAIAPRFYERLGYAIAPAWRHQCARTQALLESGSLAELTAASPRHELGVLAELHRVFKCGLHLARTEALWQTSLGDNPGDFFLTVGRPARGYARLYRDASPEAFDGTREGADSLEIVELVLCDPDDQAPVLRAIAGIAVALGCARIDSWLEPSRFVGEWFEPCGREQTLPMVSNWSDLTQSRFWSSEYF